MKLMIVLFFTLFLIGCNENSEENIKVFFQDERALRYAFKVKKELNEIGLDFDLDFNLILKDSLMEKKQAWGLSKGDTIFIDLDLFNSLDRSENFYRLENLMLHEIGHNKFKLPHCNEDCDLYQYPLIMHPYLWQFIEKDEIEQMYITFKDYYLKKI